METKNIMIVGVGGQGTLLASKILGHVLLSQNFDVKVSEVHGMSQRGGSVVTYVRYGEKVYSPVIDKGEADAIVAFEKLEAARWISYLKKGGQIIVNTQEVDHEPQYCHTSCSKCNILRNFQSFHFYLSFVRLFFSSCGCPYITGTKERCFQANS